MRKFILSCALALSLLLFRDTQIAAGDVKPPISTGALQLFASESAAQAHCPSDEVVWLNTASRIYHQKGMRWYGRTKQGAYVCRKEADAAGDRDTRNGQ